MKETEIKKLESNLKKYEDLKIKIQEAARGFIKAMKETNKNLNNSNSVGYSNVYLILAQRTELFKKNFITDFSCFYDKDLVRDILDQLIESEKLTKMESKIIILNQLLLKAEGLRNKMREQVEDSEAEELLDAIESLSLKDEISLKLLSEEIEKLKQKISNNEMVA